MLRNILIRHLHERILFIFLILFISSSIHAQTTAGIVSSGDAVVTGFSLTSKPVNDTDENFIDLNGPSVRVIRLPTSGEWGLVNVQPHFSVSAKEVGQVFGVAMDNASPPNIYVAATSAYGLAIYQKGKGRVQHGTPGAQYVPGLFGPFDQGGNSTSIWRIDGNSGKVSLFANVVDLGIENTPASLGGLAFDANSQQLFVANRATGIIHRFTLDGTDQGTYDHGVDGLTAAGQATISFDPAKIISIKNPKFNAKDPHTWGYAPIERRVFALAIHNQRLYYSVAGSQIWSVGISSQGSFVNDSRLELNFDTLKTHTEISAINFDNQGRMYIAERGFPTGDENFVNVAEGANRVIRFSPNPNNTATELWVLPGEEYAIGVMPNFQNANGGVDISCEEKVWSTGDSLMTLHDSAYIDGLQGNGINFTKSANSPPLKSWFINYYHFQSNIESHGYIGSIAIRKSCEEKITVASHPSSSPPPEVICPSGTTLTDGACVPPVTCPAGTILQNGSCVPSASSPPIQPPTCPSCCFWACPWSPWALDPWGLGPWGIGPGIWDGFGGPWGWGGGWGPWGIGPGVWDGFGGPWGVGPWGWGGGLGPWGMGPGIWDGFGGPWGPGPWGWDLWDLGPWGMGPWGWDFWGIGPWGIDPWWGLGPWGLCSIFGDWDSCSFFNWCPGFVMHGPCFSPIWPLVVMEEFVKKHAVSPIKKCQPTEHLVNGKCIPDVTCKSDERLVNGKCIPTIICKSNERMVNGKCIPKISCKSNERLVNGKCIPNITCKPYERLVDGKCVPVITCKPNERLINGKCIPTITCKPNERLVHGRCIPNVTCKPNERLINGRCIPTITCKPNERLVHGRCVPTITCKPNERLINGRCIPTIICKPNERLVHGRCIPNIICKPNERLINGRCIPTITCKPNERLVHGRCIPVITCKPGEKLINGKCVPTTRCKPYERLINGKCVIYTGPN